MALPSDSDFHARETLRPIGPNPQNWVLDREGIDHSSTNLRQSSICLLEAFG
ncbi:hypothetical protein [Mesorhizobium sp. M1A.F.Ca.ET.072.01.1.1]|uniref:hypothetical protein n=1 Tax=Mesorhizobium sp. M1A.F.Ca.ET.072.01.1.1 TaxID=2496753 RepID=UPI001677896D|nr:hypothetical protein [Mesorhizobium sp. M1A.F.Ca.ET.072.01.1.1]